MDEPTKPELTKLNFPERKRIYHYPSGETIEVKNVTHLLIRPSGTHRLMTANGRKWIITPGWLAIELDMDEWTL